LIKHLLLGASFSIEVDCSNSSAVFGAACRLQNARQEVRDYSGLENISSSFGYLQQEIACFLQITANLMCKTLNNTHN
jgi:hypothetical protein